MYAVSNRYLGPPGRTLPWQARYSAYGLWAVYALIALVIRAQLGLFPGVIGYGVVAVVAVVATQASMRWVNPDRSAASAAGLFAAELRAPRRGREHSRTTVLDPSAVSVAVTRPIPEPTPESMPGWISAPRWAGPQLRESEEARQ
ncbi:hypothetical protein [Pseudonocardia sp. ICBG601]|uniref:hypothetical protein n=1 Tax=Pseudonocardia sp. ICBG601 TaxID=2846759 RepID=UPI001CF6D35B|nr:hypothetical protein [Pseudonocardia sp. ICBG601]